MFAESAEVSQSSDCSPGCECVYFRATQHTSASSHRVRLGEVLHVNSCSPSIQASLQVGLLAERSERCVCDKEQTHFLPVVGRKESCSLVKVIGWAR